MNKLRDNVEKYLTLNRQAGTLDENACKLLKGMNETIIGAYAPMFYPDSRAHMHAPEMTFQSKPVSMTSFELYSTAAGLDKEMIFKNVTVAIRDQWYELKKQGKRFLPYIPVVMKMLIDPSTFEARRSFVTLGAVVDDVSGNYGTPLHPSEYRPLLDNVRKHVEVSQTMINPDNNSKLAVELVMIINEQLMQRYGGDLFGEPARYMHGPVGNFGGRTVTAATRKFSYELEINGMESNETIDKLVDDIALELMAERDVLADQGNVIYPYIPVGSNGMIVNARTYMPTLSFYTRYGVEKDCI